jgi:membrane-bound lytic murein transglycosylase MltF
VNVLEKILEEIKEVEKKFVAGHKVLFALGATGMASEISGIIRSHMDDVPDNNDGWIPVSEKLPEENDGKYYPMLNVSTSYGAVKWGFYRVRDKEWYIYSEMHNELIKAEDKEVIAWQPLPEPYKEE